MYAPMFFLDRLIVNRASAIHIFWHAALILVKISLRLLYVLLFTVHGKPTLKYSMHIVASTSVVVIALYLVASVLQDLLLCRPIEAN